MRRNCLPSFQISVEASDGAAVLSDAEISGVIQSMDSFMKNACTKSLLLSLVVLLITVNSVSPAQQPAPEQPPDIVEGKWTIYANDPNGSASTKYVEIKQNGTQLTGHFKGPHQSGGIEGTINEHQSYSARKPATCSHSGGKWKATR